MFQEKESEEKIQKQFYLISDKIKYNKKDSRDNFFCRQKEMWISTSTKKIRNQIIEVNFKLIVYGINKTILEPIWIKSKISK